MLACEDDHSGKSEGNDGTAEECGVLFANPGGESTGIFVLDKKIRAHKDEGAEHLNELCLSPAHLFLEFEMREVFGIENLVAVECV